MFDFLGDLFSKIWEFIKENWVIILIIILIIIAIFFPPLWAAILYYAGLVWGWILAAAEGLAMFFAALGIEGAIAAAIGMGILIDPEGTGELIGKVIGGVGDAAGSVLGALFDSPLGATVAVLGGAYLAYKIFGSDSDDENNNSSTSSTSQGGFAAEFNSQKESSSAIADSSSATTELRRGDFLA